METRSETSEKQTASLGSPLMPCSGFFIVNIHDRPSEAHIAEKREDGKFYYVHPALRHDKRFWGMTPSNPTPIEDFGMLVDVKAGIFVGVRDDTAPVTATYLDGRERRWQGSRTFSFPFQNAQGMATAACAPKNDQTASSPSP